jgi:hypothetical protein
VLAANLDDVSGFTARLGQPSVGRLNALGSGILDRRRDTWDVGPTAARHPGRRDTEAWRFSTGTGGLCGLWLFVAQ